MSRRGARLRNEHCRLALAEALHHWYQTGRDTLLDEYTVKCLRRVWRVQHLSSWMTAMLHRYEEGKGFQARLQRAQLEYLCESKAAATTLAENYVGFEFDASRARGDFGSA